MGIDNPEDNSLPTVARLVKRLAQANPLNNGSVDRGALTIRSPEGLVVGTPDGEGANQGSMVVNGKARVDGRIDVNGPAAFSGDFQSTGTSRFFGATKIEGRIDINGPAAIAGDLQVFGPTRFFGATKVDGRIDINGPAAIAGDLQVFGPASFNGPTKMVGDVDLSGTMHATGTGRFISSDAGDVNYSMQMYHSNGEGYVVGFGVPVNVIAWNGFIQLKQDKVTVNKGDARVELNGDDLIMTKSNAFIAVRNNTITLNFYNSTGPYIQLTPGGIYFHNLPNA